MTGGQGGGLPLDRHFDQRRRSPLRHHPRFTNRTAEIALLDACLADLEARSHDGDDRHNVLAFYGVGGIGKSALSRAMARRVADGGRDGAPPVRVACRLDFADPSLLHFETLVLRVRHSFDHPDLDLSSFDQVLVAYWARRHPHAPLGVMVQQMSRATRLAGAAGLDVQLAVTIEQLAGLAVTGSAWATARSFYLWFRDQVRRRRVLASLPFAEDLIAADAPEEVLPFLPAVLEHDLRRARRATRIDAAVLLDSWEEARTDPHGRRAFEDLVARMAYLMPSTLFAITGRLPVTWGHERSGAIHYSGPELWPDLAPPEAPGGRQQRLARFTPGDCVEHLRTRLSLHGRPAVAVDVCERVALASDGLPLHLETALDAFEALVVAGVDPAADAITGDLERLVAVQAAHLDADQQDVLRAAALLGAFTPELLRATAGGPPADLTAFLDEDPLFEPAGEEWFTHRIHERRREVIRRDRWSASSRWSGEEWPAAAERALAWLGRDLSADTANPAAGRIAALARGFTMGCELSAEAGRVPQWVWQAAYALRLVYRREPLEYVHQRYRDGRGPLRALALACHAMERRIADDFRSSEAALRQALTTRGLGTSESAFVHHRLAKVLEVTGKRDEALGYLRQAAGEPAYPMGHVAAKDLAFFQIFSGDPRPARRWSADHRSSPSPTERAQANGLGGWSHWLWGEFELAERLYRRTLDDHDLVRESLEQEVALRNVALATCWLRPAAAEAIAVEAVAANEVRGRPATTTTARVALAVCRITGRGEDVGAVLDEAAADCGRRGLATDLVLPLLARVLLHVASERRADAEAAHDDLVAHLDEHALLPHLAAVSREWVALIGGSGRLARRPAAWPDRDRGMTAWRAAASLRLP